MMRNLYVFQYWVWTRWYSSPTWVRILAQWEMLYSKLRST